MYTHSYLTSAVDGGECSASRRDRSNSKKDPSLPTEMEAGWALQPV